MLPRRSSKKVYTASIFHQRSISATAEADVTVVAMAKAVATAKVMVKADAAMVVKATAKADAATARVVATTTSKRMKTAVVILNWNTRDYLSRFIPAMIKSCEGLDAEVIVADNASTDGSAELMQDEFPSVRCIKLEENYGFTGGYNKALNQIDAERFVLINSDIEVTTDWLKILDKWMDEHPECGVCGPKLLSYNQRDSFEYAGAAGGYIDTLAYPYCRGRIMKKLEKDHGQHDTPENVFWVSGACLMIRSSVWKALGGLDERFFAHMEEIDLCWRAQIAGWKICNVPQSVVYHIGGGTLANDSPWKLQLNFRNNLLMMENNLPFTVGLRKAKFTLICRMLMDGLSWLAYIIQGRRDYARSVYDAHKAFRALRRGWPAQGDVKRLDGMKKGSIFIEYIKAKI